ncbi:tubulin polyglutamylase complex subunit 2 [Phymastichus coffea]|uniref:tubulin polyglutamylase complex subunit 2 n=1 Tax=Phymastichus coffea TaxID=108790 RepID=UPI00273B8949|nr:tubulin polyglutamylase complex subunit 2 [Phymastichus coffea]
MSFFVDIVSEDSFYENLMLGVSKLLEANPCVKNVQLERRGACDRAALSTWEQKHCCLLTEDLRNFYASTDGFLLTWSLEISGEEFPIGRMEVKELVSLRRHVGVPINNNAKDQTVESTSSNTSVSSDEVKSMIVEPTFGGSRCKLFELAECAHCRIFLAYQLQPDQDEPSVWLYNTPTNRWHYLADSFSKYFRMMLVHLGLPMWQVCAAGLQLPTWLEQVYLLVGPHLLPSTSAATATRSVSTDTSLWNDGPINVIDPGVFRGKDHHYANTTGSGGAGAGTSSKQKTTTTSTTASTSTSTSNARKKLSSH